MERSEYLGADFVGGAALNVGRVKPGSVSTAAASTDVPMRSVGIWFERSGRFVRAFAGTMAVASGNGMPDTLTQAKHFPCHFPFSREILVVLTKS